jgi:hypothetical protein
MSASHKLWVFGWMADFNSPFVRWFLEVVSQIRGKCCIPFGIIFFLKGTGGAELIVEDALFFVELEHICMGRLDIHSHPPGGVVIKLGTGWQLFF